MGDDVSNSIELPDSPKRKSKTRKVLESVAKATIAFGAVKEIAGVAAIVSLLSDGIEFFFPKQPDKRSATSKKHGWK